MKKFYAIAVIVLSLIVSLYITDNAFADKMWSPAISNMYFDLSGGATAVDFYYTVDPQDSRPGDYRLQMDDSPSFSSLNVDIPLNALGTIQNINISSIGSGNIVYWRLVYLSYQQHWQLHSLHARNLIAAALLHCKASPIERPFLFTKY